MKEVIANYHANGGLAGATDYTITGEVHRLPAWRRPLVRVHRSGKVELYGQASNQDWALLIEGMLWDRSNAWTGHDNSRKVGV